jgi:hypothetical protein
LASWLAPFITGLFGVLTGISAQWWRSSRDELRILCDEFCKLVAETVHDGAQYWMSDGDLALYEARLRGAQRQIIGFSVLLEEQLHEGASNEIDKALSKFFQAMTGGDFSVPNRPKSVSNAQRCHETAADVILSVRQGFFYSVRFREKLWRLTVGRMSPKSKWYGTFAKKE